MSAFEAPPHIFMSGWPKEISYEALRPFYTLVGEMLDVQPLPDNQLTPRFKLMQEAASRNGDGHRFSKLPLAVSFDPEWHYDLEDQFKSRS